PRQAGSPQPAGPPRGSRARGETVHPPPPPPSRSPTHRARRSRGRSTTVAADASRCPPPLVVLVPVPPQESRGRRSCPVHRHVNNGQIRRTSLFLWHLTPRFRRRR